MVTVPKLNINPLLANLWKNCLGGIGWIGFHCWKCPQKFHQMVYLVDSCRWRFDLVYSVESKKRFSCYTVSFYKCNSWGFLGFDEVQDLLVLKAESMLFLWDIFSQQNLGEGLFPWLFVEKSLGLWMIGNERSHRGWRMDGKTVDSVVGWVRLIITIDGTMDRCCYHPPMVRLDDKSSQIRCCASFHSPSTTCSRLAQGITGTKVRRKSNGGSCRCCCWESRCGKLFCGFIWMYCKGNGKHEKTN